MTDLSEAAQDRLVREFTSRQILEMPGGRMFSRAYFPAEEIAQMAPEERQASQELMTLLKVLNYRARERKMQRLFTRKKGASEAGGQGITGWFGL
jgi:hypothetical protein